MRNTRGPITGADLKAARTLRGWTQRDLARAIGVSQVSVHRFECGTRPITTRVTLRITRVFESPP